MNFKTLGLAGLLLSSVTVSTIPQAHAVALLTQSMGLGLLAFGGTLAVSRDAIKNGWFQAPLMLGFAVLVLDKETNQVTFNALTEEAAQNYHISEEEMKAYNSELDRINGAYDDMDFKLSQADSKNRNSVAKEAYEALKAEVSPDAFSALTKISKAIVK